MDGYIKFSDSVAIGAQPTEDDLRSLREQGFETIINLREKGEGDQPLDPEKEGEMAEDMGLGYVHYPIAADGLCAEKVDAFSDIYSMMAKPAFVHCKRGTRAAALMLMYIAARDGMTPDQAFAHAAAKGVNITHPGLREFMSDYIQKQTSA